MTGVDLAYLKQAVGRQAYTRGLEYARDQAVVGMGWDASAQALTGRVRGRLADFYDTKAYFSSVGDEGLEFELGECDCPVGIDCKHVAALVLTAADPERARRLGEVSESAEPEPREVAVPGAWEASLGSLFASGQGRLPGRSDEVPLAIELTLSVPKPPGHLRGTLPGPRLHARLVKPGRNGWVRGDLSWSRLGHLSYGGGGYAPAQVGLLQEFYGLYRSRGDRWSYYSSDEKTIDLAAFGSRQLWTMLDELYEAGVRLVHGKKHLGDVERPGAAEVCVDVSGSGSDELVVRPVVSVEGCDVDPVVVGFMGAEGHGLVYTDRAETARVADPSGRRLWLARLTRGVEAGLQQMALDGQELRIPAAEVGRFRDKYYPRLRHLAPVISSDESFVPPVISDPRLLLLASYGDGHQLDVSWQWAYEVGDTRLLAPLDPAASDDGGHRDLERERAVLAEVNAVLASYEFLWPPGGQRTVAAQLVLDGLATMRFSTEVLPLLADHPQIVVEVGGDPAEYREAGDSLTIAVSTDAVDGETDWFDLGITVAVEGCEVPFAALFTALATGQSSMLLPDGAYFSLDKPELRALRTLIEEARALQDKSGGSLRISRFQVGLWDELAALGVVSRQAESWQRQVAELRSVDAVAAVGSADVPVTLEAHLRPYQLDGFRWLDFLWRFQLGGILADDMGLGKTLQTLTLICQARQTEPTGQPFLIVAPTSVVSNWATEAARFAPGLDVVPITDTLRRRGRTLPEVIGQADVVVTSYTLFRLDIDAYAELSWSGLILDEAQFVKNHQSKVHQCARRLEAPYKLAITGTPMENNLMELWSLLSITAPGLFPSPTRFDEYYARPIEKRGDTERLAQLRRRIKPLVKRRTKEQVVADLPAKQEQVVDVDLHPRHRKVYQTHLQRERQKVLGLVGDLDKNRFTIFRSLTLLRQLSLHAGLIDDKYDGMPSAKVEALLEQLQDVVDSGHRALVFSQFTGFLELVRRRLNTEGVEYCYLDGKTRNRPAVLTRFKDGKAPVFLISLKAGGFGLNLTEADYCFLLDPWWNPATEAQAVDRIHRIGQTRNVMVYRLIARDTIEEKVMALKEKKAELFAGVMDDGNAFGAAVDADDIRGLFGP